MDLKREIIISAFLHDIGKFAQRADIEQYKAKNMEDSLCPFVKEKGYFSHKHTLYTQGFMEANSTRNVLHKLETEKIDIVKVIQLAANHHKPSSFEEWLIAHADRLSSGSDRLHEFERDNEHKYYETPFIEIVSEVNLKNQQKCELKKISLGREEYKKMWNDFETEFCNLKYRDYENFIEELDNLLKKHTGIIPSATNADADIGLYQHAKTTAAFASALYEYYKENKMQFTEFLPKDEQIFLFINGDLSGIQKYIFDIKITEDSAKKLRAKSFEIKELCNSESKKLAKEFGVSYANVLTNAGGKFLLVVPNTSKNRELLPELKLKIEEKFVEKFAGKLSLNISTGIPATAADLEAKNIKKLLLNISHQADIAKQNKFQAYIIKYGAKLNVFDDEQIEKKEKELANEGTKLRNKPPYYAPRNEDGVLLTFEDIANKSTGNNKLAMFKADIDNLGFIFNSGLGSRISFSRVAQLSETLNHFFTYAYYKFVENHSHYKDKIYTVFSGGDDLCVLGAWDAVINFANEFHKKFKEFTNNNPSITISAGISLVNSRLPIKTIAREAEEYLEKSKNDQNKNKVTVFDTTVSWSELDNQIKNAAELINYLENEIISLGSVYKMIGFIERAKNKDYLWISNLTYMIARNIKNENAKKLFLDFRNNIKESRIAVSYALYTQRGKNGS